MTFVCSALAPVPPDWQSATTVNCLPGWSAPAQCAMSELLRTLLATGAVRARESANIHFETGQSSGRKIVPSLNEDCTIVPVCATASDTESCTGTDRNTSTSVFVEIVPNCFQIQLSITSNLSYYLPRTFDPHYRPTISAKSSKEESLKYQRTYITSNGANCTAIAWTNRQLRATKLLIH